MQNFINLVDKLNTAIMSLLKWAVLLMVLLAVYNAIVRYLSKPLGMNLSSNFFIEWQWYLFSAVFLLGFAPGLKDNVHVRVDVLSSRWSEKAKAWLNILGVNLLLIPFCVATIYVSLPWVANSWAVKEVSPDPEGLVRYPIKALVPFALLMLLLQGLAELFKSIHVLRQKK